MRSTRSDLPLITFALCFALLSAAAAFGQAVKGAHQNDRRRVITSGRLTGTREVLQVVTWQTRGSAHLAVIPSSPGSQVLWQTDGRNDASRVDSVRVWDLDGDGIPEIISLWWMRSSPGAELRVFHWDRQQNSFVELQSEMEINRVRSYRIARVPGNSSLSRILVETHSERSASRSPGQDIAYELRGSRLVRDAGGPIVATQDDSGIEGQAVIGPARPGPTRQDMPNTVPYKTTLIVWSADGDREVRRLETGSDGRFRVSLPPGTYRVGPPHQTGRFLPRAAEETVTVVSGKYVRVIINFDSGIR